MLDNVAETRIDIYNRKLGALRQERQSFIPHWRELSDFVQPRRGRFLISDRNKGGQSKRNYSSIINSRATQALRIARSGMLNGTMSPARPWFGLEPMDIEMLEFAPVKEWLYKQEILLRTIFNAGNLYNMSPTFLEELLLFGTAAMSQVDDFDDVARFYTHTIGSYMVSQNDRFKVDTLVREFQMTTEQMIGKFGKENVSIAVLNEYERGSLYSWHNVVHFIEPNPDVDERKIDSKFKKFRSVYYEPGDNNKDKFLSERGFDEFPAYVARWDVTGEDIYGTNCPGMTALGDIKALQIEEKRKAQGIDKMVNPPLKGPASLKNVPVSSLPGGLTIYDTGQGDEKLSSIYTVQPQLNDLMLDIDKVERRIETAFYVDMFLAISNMEGIQPRNQLDLTQRNEERLIQLGPVLERIHGEFLERLIDRTFSQALRAGIVSPPPQELLGQELRVKFISTLAMAQKAVAVAEIERFAGYVGSLVAFAPDAVDKFDYDQSMDEYGLAIGVPPHIIVPDEEVLAKRQQRAQAQQAQQALEGGQGAADITKKLTDSKTDDSSVLTNIRDTLSEQASGS